MRRGSIPREGVHHRAIICLAFRKQKRNIGKVMRAFMANQWHWDSISHTASTMCVMRGKGKEGISDIPASVDTENGWSGTNQETGSREMSVTRNTQTILFSSGKESYQIRS